MSFSPRNVSQLIVADTSAADLAAQQTAKTSGTVGAFLLQPKADPNTASGKLANLGASIIAVTATGGDAVSEFVKTADVDDIYSGVLEAGVNKTVTATYTAPSTFENKSFFLTINVNDHIGSMLNESRRYYMLKAMQKVLADKAKNKNFLNQDFSHHLIQK